MKIAFISATKASIDPIEKAINELSTNVEYIHLMDTDLLLMLSKEGQMTSAIIQRFTTLINLAVASEVNAIQLTCSAFNDLVQVLQPLYNIKIFRSDEAMLDQAAMYKSIGLISTVLETPPVLIGYLKSKQPNVQIETSVSPGLIHLLYEDRKDEHDLQIKKMIKELEEKVDVIVLSQFSLAHIAKQINCSVPIIAAPDAAAKRCYEYIKSI